MDRIKLTFPFLVAFLALTVMADSSRIQTLNRMVSRYSKQKIILLDIDEKYTFIMKNEEKKIIHLCFVDDFTDSVVNLERKAVVGVKINGKRLKLICSPYRMPAVFEGIRIQADSTSGYKNVPARVQFSIWDASDPIVDTERFGFPIRNYQLFSHSLQAYNEPGHMGLGNKDGMPAGNLFYHDYGIDIAGYECKEEIVSATDGAIIFAWPKENPWFVGIQDDAGLIWEYGHLEGVLPEIKEGSAIKKGDKIGFLGKTGGSGNFSQLHLGTYLSKEDLTKEFNRNLNLYPWIVAAHQHEYRRHLYAVAGPHQVAKTGESVTVDGSNSLSFNSEIVSYTWEFPDGETVNKISAEKVFSLPGIYTATLKIKDSMGNEDADFCKIIIHRRGEPKAIPGIFMSHTPTNRIFPGMPVRFRCWFPENKESPASLDFGDGRIIADYTPYSEITHKFKTPGIHIVTLHTTVDNKPITFKQKVIVEGDKK